jgi:membrane protein YdbS with pleckstrin-like domain
MYSIFRTACERLLKIPHPPEAPPGDEKSTKLFRAANNYYRYLLCVWALRSLGLWFAIILVGAVPLIAVAIAEFHNNNRWAAGLVALAILLVLAVVTVSLFGLAILKLDFEQRWYMVTDRSLRIREGVVVVREMTVNFANIQNISISQGPLQRALGLADLRVDTAGGGAKERPGAPDLHTAWFRGIDNAGEVRQLIQDRLQRLKGAGLGDPEDAARHGLGAAGGPVSAGLLEALRGVQQEARALREVAAADSGR